MGAQWALSLDHGREGAAVSWELPTGSPLPAVESPPGPPRWLDSKLHQIPPGAPLWAAPCLDPREPRDGPPHPVDLCSPLPDPQEPRAGPLHPTDVCSPLPRPVGAKGWASTPHGHLQPPAWTPGSGPGVGPHTWQGSAAPPPAAPWVRLAPLGPHSPQPTWSRAWRGPPIRGAGSPPRSPRGLHHLHHLPYPGRSLPPPASICALRAGRRTVPPQPPLWWDRLMAWASSPPPPGLSAPWACTCPRSPPPWTRGAPHADGLHQSLTPPGTAIASHGLSLGVTHRTLVGCRGAESSSFWETAAPPPQ